MVYDKTARQTRWPEPASSARSAVKETDKDIQDGKLKIFVISGECHEAKYAGTNDGPFEAWTAEYYPPFPWPERYSIEEKIKAYNRHMRSQYERSLAHTNAVKSSR
jgi:hypothetical protein